MKNDPDIQNEEAARRFAAADVDMDDYAEFGCDYGDPVSGCRHLALYRLSEMDWLIDEEASDVPIEQCVANNLKGYRGIPCGHHAETAKERDEDVRVETAIRNPKRS